VNEIVYLNGAFVPLQDAKIPVLDYGFLFAYGLYETTRAYGGQFFRLEAHLQRLAKSAQALNLPVDLPHCHAIIRETVRRNPFPNSRMRLTLTAGPGAAAADLRSCSAPTLLVSVVEYQPLSAGRYAQGYSAIVGSPRRNSQSLLPTLKSSSFVESLLAKQEARQQGVDEALLLNDKGILAEASSSNVFVVSRGVLKTPRAGSGFLPGITRGVVLELAERLKLEYLESDIPPAELSTAEELFITNSMIEIMPVTTLQGRAVGAGRPGPLTLRLAAAYQALLRAELR
jgi:branched-chain amino acid aminotransferase